MTEFYFAWVNPGETTYVPATHAREDEAVFSFVISQAEGEFAVANIEVRRPESGLLNPSRKQYAWISCTKPDGNKAALFFGRVTAFPENITGEVVKLELVAQFPGWEADRLALFATLKVAPFWDVAFIPATDIDDPETAIEARTARYHYHRLTGAVTLSDIFEGTQSITIAETDAFRDALQFGITGKPAKRAVVTARVEWEQRIGDFSNRVNTSVRKAFEAGVVNSYTGADLAEAWPKVGDAIGGGSGYTVVRSRIRKYQTTASDHSRLSPAIITKVPEEDRAIVRAATGQDVETREAKVERSWFETDLTIWFDYRQARAEELTVTVENDVQALAFDDDQIEIDIDLQGEDVVGLGLMRALERTWFLTARGEQSFGYLLAVARAHLANSARALEVSGETSFWDGIALSCDHTATVQDSRLPGGEATGKVVWYELRCTGDTGDLTCAYKVAVSVGNGETYVSSGRTRLVFDEDTAEENVGETTGQTTPTGLTDMIYEPYNNQVPLPTIAEVKVLSGNIVQSVTVTNPPEEQETHLQANQYPERDNLAGVLASVPTAIELTMYPLTAEDLVEHSITVTMAQPYAAPMGVDLAA